LATSTEINTVNSCVGPDVIAYTNQSSYVNWLGENSRARRTQTPRVTTEPIAVQTEDTLPKISTTSIGNDPIYEILKEEKTVAKNEFAPALSMSENLNKSIQSLSSDKSTELAEEGLPKAEPREFDPFCTDENEIIYLFRSTSSDKEGDDQSSEEGEGEMRTLICKETRDMAVGPDSRDIKEEAIRIIQELMINNPEDYKTILGKYYN